MKITTLLIFLFLSTNSIAGQNRLIIPTGYLLLEDRNGSVIYDNADYYVITVDLENSKLNFNNIKKSSKQTNKWHTEYEKFDLFDSWDNYSSSRTLALVNGQFFNVKQWGRSPLSYALKADGIIYQNSNDKDSNGKDRSLNSLLQLNGKYYLKSGFSQALLNSYTDVFVTWHRSEEIEQGELKNKDNRTYLGVFPKSDSCDNALSACELISLVFLIAKNKTASQAINELNRFGVNNSFISRMDGGGSTQFISNSGHFYEGFVSPRNMPHMIEILDKGLSTGFDSVKILKKSRFREIFFILSQLKFFLRIVYR